MKHFFLFSLFVIVITSNLFAGPCNTIIPITCDSSYLFSVPFGYGDPRFTGKTTGCSSSTSNDGLEAIYKFVAPVTGLYQIGANTAPTGSRNIQYSYKLAGTPCDSLGWICLNSITTLTQVGSINLQANDSIYLLLNNTSTSSNQQSFTIHCGMPFECEQFSTVQLSHINQFTIPIGYGDTRFPNVFGQACSGVTANAGGYEKLFKFTAPSTGYYQFNTNLFNSNQNTFSYKSASLVSCDSSGWKCIGNPTSAGVFGTIFLNNGDSIWILANNQSIAKQIINFWITYLPAYCEKPTPISCGVEYTFSVPTFSGPTEYKNGMGTNCFSTSGSGGFATFYKLIAPVTGNYQLSTKSNSTFGSVEYFYKAANSACDTSGWTCINYTALVIPNMGSINLNAGDSIILLVKAETKFNVSQNFLFVCPAGCQPLTDTPTIALSNSSGFFCKGDSVALSLLPSPPATLAVNWTIAGNINSGLGYVSENLYSPPIPIVGKDSRCYIANLAYCGSKVVVSNCIYRQDTLHPFLITAITDTIQCVNVVNGPLFKLSNNLYSSANPNAYHFFWKRNGVAIGGDTSMLVTNLGGVYTLEIANACGTRASTNSKLLTVAPLDTLRPRISIKGPVPFCQSDTFIELSLNPNPNAYSYSLFKSDFSQSTPFVTNTTGVFRVFTSSNSRFYIRYSLLCQSGNSDTITVPPSKTKITPFSISGSNSITKCSNDGLEYLAVSPQNTDYYIWTINGISTNSVSSSMSFSQSSVVSVAMTNVCGLVNSTNTVTVTFNPTSYTNQTEKICYGSTYNFYGQILSTPGSYTNTFKNMYRCDSTIHLDLSYYPQIVPTIFRSGTSLTTQAYNTYQWCIDNRMPISGANSRTYEIKENGYYSVRVTDAYGCIDYSDFFTASFYDIKSEFAEHFSLVPNPTSGYLTIHGLEPEEEYKISVIDIQGRVIIASQVSSGSIDVSSLENGIYQVQIVTRKYGTVLKPFVKE